MLVCIVGNFGENDKVTDGQSIKTIELYRLLLATYGCDEVCKVNLYKKNKIRLAIELLAKLIRCKNIIVLVSQNGRRTVIPLLVMYNKFFHKNIFHSLIGSTTHQLLEKSPKYVKCYNRLAGNWAETNTEKKLLEEYGLNNVSVVSNFKRLRVLRPSELSYNIETPFYLCTFSRVEELKGIPNIVNAIKKANELIGKTAFKLDIYGTVMETYKDKFEQLKEEFGSSIRYRGVVDFSKSVETIKDYFMLVFPTKYYTEGVPGTILDAFAAGVPVLSAEWESCFDVINERVGITYDFNSDEALLEALLFIFKNPSVIISMKEYCLIEATKYTPKEVAKTVDMYFKGE